MASPVVVSRIQNRRGTLSQFNGPPGAIYPTGYDGIGGYNPPGTGPVGFTPSAYPNVLMPGELALCTDTRRVFMGNLNGEYVEVTSPIQTDILLRPHVVVLPPAAVFTAINPANGFTLDLDFDPTPFFTLLYDITDATITPPPIDWNIVGTNFSRNGEMKITAAGTAPSILPTLTDSSTEMNLTVHNISFIAQYNGTSNKIEILYMHDFVTSLTFSTSTIRWIPF